MTLHQLHCSLTSFLTRIEQLSGTALHDAFVGEVIETCGTYIDPPADDDGTSHLLEISLHDVVGRGASEPEAFANWTQAAERMADRLLDDDGFITVHPPFPHPRNHAEEIANAQATAGAAATTHDETTRAPTLAADNTPTFHCPLWPGCGCPGGAMRPECPGLKSRIGLK